MGKSLNVTAEKSEGKMLLQPHVKLADTDKCL